MPLKHLRSSRVWKLGIAALCLAFQHECVAQTQPGVVGVLRPTVHTGFKQMVNRVPPQYRAMIEASLHKLEEFYAAQAPLAVQNTWVEMLERKGFPAVALEADTAEAAGEEVRAKGVRWLLSSSVDAGSSPVSPGMQAPATMRGVQVGGTASKASLDLEYTLRDEKNHILVPLQRATFSSMTNEQGPREDLWAEAGDAMLKFLAGALPLGTQREPAASVLRPAVPDMADSVRFDIAVSKVHLYNGKPIPGTDAGSRSAILAFAGGAVTTQDRGTGVIYTPGATRLFLLNDTARTYSSLTAEDLAYIRKLEEMGKPSTPSQPKLLRVGTEGRVVHYRLQREDEGQTPEQMQAAAMAASNLPERYKRRLEQTKTAQETGVDVEYGDPEPAWQQGMHAMAGVFAAAGGWPIDLAEDQQVANAVWLELAASPAPPLRISIHDARTTQYKEKKASAFVDEVQATFATPKLARAVDFALPRDYTWHSNPVLAGLFQ